MALSTRKFNSGGSDVVRLNSGGPLMSVLHYDENGLAVCEWQDDGKTTTGAFPEASLHYASIEGKRSRD